MIELLNFDRWKDDGLAVVGAGIEIGRGGESSNACLGRFIIDID